jgi:hypothetical protein
MLSNNYYKYLKYKNKYLSLKNKLNGGANCPKIGFHQHYEECWQDAFQMIALYNDGIGDNLQDLFDSFADNLNHKLLRYLNEVFRESPIFLLPYNIPNNAIDNKSFRELLFEYLHQLCERYLNDKKPEALEVAEPDTKKVATTGLFRQDSVGMSLICAHNTFRISNINRQIKRIPKQGGTILETIINIGILNYTYFYKFDKCMTIDVFDLEFISRNYYNYFMNGDGSDEDDYGSGNNLYVANVYIIDEIDILLKKLTEYNNILFSICYDNQRLGHTTSFFTCNRRPIYFDNEGIGDKTAAQNNRTTIELDIKTMFVEILNVIKSMVDSEDNEILIKEGIEKYKEKYIMKFISNTIITRCNKIYPNTFHNNKGDEPYFENFWFLKIQDIKISNLNEGTSPRNPKIYNDLQNEYYSMTQNLLQLYYTNYKYTRRIAELNKYCARESYSIPSLPDDAPIEDDDSLEDIDREFPE